MFKLRRFNKPTGKPIRFQNEGEGGMDEGGGGGGGSKGVTEPAPAGTVDVTKTIDLINELAEIAGLPKLPDGTDESNFNDRFFSFVKMVKEFAGREEPEPEPETPEPIEVPEDLPAEVAGAFSALAEQNKQIATQFASLQKEIKDLRSQGAANNEVQFSQRLDSLVKSGRVTPAQRTSLHAAGKATGWQFSLLDPFEASKPGGAVPLDRVNVVEDPTSGGKAETAEEKKARALKEFGIKSA